MIIHLNENIFNKLFLVESKNSDRAHRQTRELMAKFLGKAVDDPYVISTEQSFEKKMFGEGLRTDWFITLEPYAYNWVTTSSVFGADGVYNILKYLFTKAQTVENRTAFMQQVKSFQTFTEIRNFVGENQKADRAYARENGTKQNNLNSNYQVLGPLSFEEAKEYGNYSGFDGGKGGRICYSQSKSTWLSSSYSNNNTNECFILLRNDWNRVSTEHDGSEKNNGLPEPLNQYNGYDDYGLSMIFVWINPNGELHECNTRWNHEARYAPGHSVDLALTQTDIERLMGAPFEAIFNSTNFYDKADEASDRLAKGDNIATIFDFVERISKDYTLVGLNGKYNIFSVNEKKLLFPHDWFKGIGLVNEFGDFILSYNNDYIFLENYQKLYSFEEYTNLLENRLKEGFKPQDLFSYVQTFGRYGLVSITSKPLGNSKINFDAANIYNFETEELMSNYWANGGRLYTNDNLVMIVQLTIGDEVKYNFMAINGSRLLLDAPVDEWYDGYSGLILNGKTCYRIMTDDYKENLAVVKDDGSFEFVFNQYFEEIEANESINNEYSDYIFLNLRNEDQNFYGDCYGNIYKTNSELINRINEMISSGNEIKFHWFYKLFTNEGESTNFAKIGFYELEENKYNIYDSKNKKLILPNFVDDVSIITSDGLFNVEVDGKENITYLGEKMLYDLPLEKWPDRIENSSGGTKILFSLYWEHTDSEGYSYEWANVMDTKGNLLLKENCESMTPFVNGVCVIENKDEKFNFVDEDLNPLFEEWFDEIDMYEFEDVDIGFVPCTPNRVHSSPTFFSKISHKLITKDEIEKTFYDYLSNDEYAHNMITDIINDWGDFDADNVVKNFNDDILLNNREEYYVANERIDNWLYKWLDYFIEKNYDELFEKDDEV